MAAHAGGGRGGKHAENSTQGGKHESGKEAKDTGYVGRHRDGNGK